ncbi:MAG: hypothetical protein NXI32_07495 [bacterium]|nr:hypothetical protein [bacterium]
MQSKYYSSLAVAMLALCGLTSSANAEGPYHPHPLFSNEYTQGNANQATAQMYVAPVPVPTWVGHTYYTYQPLYPHEMMYLHGHRYHNYYDGGRGLNRTGTHYWTMPVVTQMKMWANAFSIPRRY